MTIIVAIKDDKKIIMGADSIGVSHYDKVERVDTKIFKKNNFLIGFTSSYRMGQILNYIWTPPEHPKDMPNMEYMVSTVVTSIIDTFEKEKYAKVNNNRIEGGTFLIGYKNSIYKIDSDFQVAETMDNYDACGCGESYALGTFYATELMELKPRERVNLALKSAIKFSSGCGGHTNVLEMRIPNE
jgi:ATP-dependent protease HslVU (ClpYQ) peptidase subunit